MVSNREEEQLLESKPYEKKMDVNLADTSGDSDTYETIYDEKNSRDQGVLAQVDFNMRHAGRWLLKVVGGPNNGAEFSMQAGGSYIIGTDPTSCDIVFHDNSVSRQHARITIQEDRTILLEDLKSRNGTLIDGTACNGKVGLESNALVSLGTSSFIVFDRESDMQTIIAPLLPSIVKVLQKGPEGKEAPSAAETGKPAEAPEASPITLPTAEEKQRPAFKRFALIGGVSAIFLLLGIGFVTLFQSSPIEIAKPIDYDAELRKALADFPSVRFSYAPISGRLLLVGHVLTLSDKNQLLYNIENLKFPKSLDDSGLIVDEFVWREINSILNKDPRWRGIGIHSPSAGTFVLSGYLQTRKQAEELNDYITSNFPYLDLLERRVIVEEDVLAAVDIQLQNVGIKNTKLAMNNGELTLTANLSKEQAITLNRILPELRKIPGVRTIKPFITEVEAEQTLVNISERYPVTGFSRQGGSNFTVIINGRILSRGDTLDGMTITSIGPNTVFLEKGGIKYRIDYNQQ